MADGVGNLFVWTIEAEVDYEAAAAEVSEVVEVAVGASESAPVELSLDPVVGLSVEAGDAVVEVRGSVIEDAGGILISDPGDVEVQTVESADFATMEANAEAGHAMPKLDTIDPDAETYTTSGNWPAGTWEQGYFDDSTSWYQDAHPNGNYFGAHVRVRRSCEFGRAYIWSLFAGEAYAGRAATRIKDAVDYLRGVQVDGDPYDSSRDGGWISWIWRRDRSTLILDESYWFVITPGPDNRVDLNWFSTGRALAFISAAYVQAVQDGATAEGDADYVDPLDAGIANLLTETGDVGTYPSPNVNYHASALWGLVQAHKAGRTVGMSNIEAWTDAILSAQDTDPESDLYGAFYIEEDVDVEGDPSQNFYHDAKVNYLSMDARALAEVLTVLPHGSRRDSVRTALKLLLNHIIDTRFAPDGTLYTHHKTVEGDDPNPSNSGTQALELMLVGFCRALVAAETEGGFLLLEKERVLQAASRVATGIGKASRYSLAGWACYKSTVDWWQAGASGTDILLELP